MPVRIQCQSRDLFEATNLVAGVVASNPTRPILHSLLLRGDAAGVVVQGTDLDVALSVRVDEAVVEKEGAVVLPAASFHAILREMRDPQISVEESDDRGRIQICSGSSSFWIPAGPVEEFPQIEFRPPASTLRIDRRAFLEMLRCVSVAAARDASRFQIHSVMVECVDEGIRLVSTDGKRMAIAERPVSEEESEGVGGSQYIIPLKGVDLLMKILPL
ncbi:MAG: hypothetical protein ACE5GW_09380, partial [Planctomycetota bacterium]